MARPTARVLALLEILQSGRTRTVAELAARLAVDERTVRRYVQHLIDLDIPVTGVRGRYGGYRLAPGFRMPPLMLTDDEALAVMLGLAAGRRSGTVTTSTAAVDNATAKLYRVLPQPLARRLDALLQTTQFTGTLRAVATQDTEILLTIAEAARDHRLISLNYTNREDRPSTRTVHPYGLVAHSGHWYLTGKDSLSDDVRTFRFDRITNARTLRGSFDVPVGFDPVTEVLTGLAQTPYTHSICVRVQARLADIRPRLPPALATIEELHDPSQDEPWVRVQIQAERLDWIPPLIAALDRPFVIEQPDHLRALMRELAHRLLDATKY